jgi:hypothetical protein
MTGVIWIIQMIHYPSFLHISPDRFPEFHRFHSSQITWIVGPMMLLQLGSALSLTWSAPALYPSFWNWVFLGLSLAVFFATAAFSIPAHQELSQAFQPAALSRLVQTNWIRTVLWTLHCLLCFWVLISSRGSAA